MKMMLLLAVLILAACSAQPAAPTATLAPTASQTQPPTVTAIPSPTLSPELTALQTQIAADTQDLTLRNDGTLDYKGQTYKGLNFVDGAWQLTLADGTVISNLDKSKVHFSDEDGVKIDGYTNDAGKGWNVEVTNESKFQIINTNIHQLNVQGASITAEVSTDLSAKSYGVEEVDISPDTLAKLSARVFNNFFNPGVEDTQANADAFMKACVAGTPAERTEMVYTTTGGMTPESLRLVLNCGKQGMPEDAIPISELEIRFGGGWFERAEGNGGSIYSPRADMPWINVFTKKSGNSAGIIIDKITGKMILVVGYSLPLREGVEARASAALTEGALIAAANYPTTVNDSGVSGVLIKADKWVGSLHIK